MFRRSNLWTGALLVALSAVLLVPMPIAAADEKPAASSGDAKIEVVFVLDTTGSMGKLIEGAKAKIWAICNQIASGKPTPELKVGLVAFRDRGDQYITKKFDLSDNLDDIYAQLKKFQAQGGGDGPESVNEALRVAVNDMKWTKGDDVLRLVFLVGDAPPHMDYANDVKYPETCKKACEQGIIINTIQCGNDTECAKHWKAICIKAEGSYVQIAQDGGVAPVVATPFDPHLAAINSELSRSTVVFGSRMMQEQAKGLARDAAALPAPAAAERAGFNAKNGQNATYDLVDAVKRGKVKLEELKKDELPPELQNLKPEERKAYLEKLDKHRQHLQKQAIELDKLRAAYIAEHMKKTEKKSEFDGKVLEILRKQAKKVQY